MVENRNQEVETPDQVSGGLTAVALEAMREMEQLTVIEIRELQIAWIEETKRLGLSEWAATYANELCRLAIERKRKATV